ncbi:phosphotransferase family protein [Kitasatospora cinereorecta]|uniref:Phosphotransferase family protein n=1 Tax=Kitasatospora cinereorecta TaxID=285560 RepID=A0ABW0VLQ4_9ACTN
MSAAIRIGGFTESEVSDVLAHACRLVDLDPVGAKMLRGHTNAVFSLTSAPVVAKIARRGTPLESVRSTVRLVEWLMRQDFPTVRLLPVEQPVVVPTGQAVTFWEYLPQVEQPVPAAAIARPLKQLHQLPAPPFEIRPLDTVGAIRRSLAVITALPRDDIAYLRDRLEGLEKALADVVFALPPGLLQGDPQHRNALHHPNGAVLCDWDTACSGAPEMDLVTVEIHCRRFGYGRAHYEAFASSYGFDVTAWPGYGVLRDLRELRMITTNAKRAVVGTRTLAEVTARVEGLRREDHELRWNIL